MRIAITLSDGKLDPELPVRAYLAGEIGVGANACDH